MSKQGQLIALAEDQEGAQPSIVTPDNPLPITSKEPLKVEQSTQSIQNQSALQESIDNMVSQLKILNSYMAKGFDEEITEEDTK